MESATWHDWVLWITGAVLGVAGASLLAWALFWDRARGRKRCPKCWYDMSGTGRTSRDGVEAWYCPECGRAARTERRLQRTRRRWRWAALAGLLLVGAYVACVAVDVRRHGWWGAAPRWVVILAIPKLEDRGTLSWQTYGQDPLDIEIRRRLLESEWRLSRLWWPERCLLRRSCERALAGREPDRTKHLAAHFLVMLRADALERTPAAARGYIVLARASQVRGTCASNRDSGRVGGDDTSQTELWFLTAFRRSGEFRFEYVNPAFADRYVIWSAAGATHNWWSIGRETRESSLVMAVAGATGVSMGTAHTIPRLLIPDQLARSWALTDLGAADLAGEETIEGHACWRVTGENFMGSTSVWIDKSSFLVRRIGEGRGSLTTYDPEINVTIDPAWFEFDPQHPELSPLQTK